MRLAASVLWALMLGGCAGAASLPTTTATGATEQIPIEVQKPNGPGPFPAVVIVHDCSGLGTTSPRTARATPTRRSPTRGPSRTSTARGRG